MTAESPTTPSREPPRVLRRPCPAGVAVPPRRWAPGPACASKLPTSSADYYTSDESQCQRRADWYGMRCSGGVERVGEGSGTRLSGQVSRYAGDLINPRAAQAPPSSGRSWTRGAYAPSGGPGAIGFGVRLREAGQSYQDRGGLAQICAYESVCRSHDCCPRCARSATNEPANTPSSVVRTILPMALKPRSASTTDSLNA